MDKSFPPIMKKLIKELAKMPGIGPVSAERLAFYIIKAGEEDIKHLLYSIHEAKIKIRFCSVCNNLSEEDKCHICTDTSRNRSLICVVDSPSGVLAMERSGSYKG
ncbi:MAG: recombination protein RecR, partial [Candidatus Omnitrophica bacterium]|nr:recombination protein RecR [Candidatus Omnitrophota bacterium]